MSNGFLDDLPELELPGGPSTKRKKAKLQAKTGNGQDQVVRYIRPRCPKCGSDKVPVYDSSHLPIRYHKCSNCGHTFKSVEENYRNR